MPKVLAGPFHTWAYNGHSRRFANLCLPWMQAIEFFRRVPFDAATGHGCQRNQIKPHAKNLARIIERGEYTPTDFAVSVPPHLQSRIHFETAKDGTPTFRLELQDRDVLPETDGGHRSDALQQLYEECERQSEGAPTQEARDKALHLMQQIEQLPISFKLYLDGEPLQDFGRLQEGRAVDKTLLLSIALATDEFKDDASYSVAKEIATVLNGSRESEFMGRIRFDTTTDKKLTLKTLTADGSGDLSTSLIGLARVGGYFDQSVKTMAHCVAVCQRRMLDKLKDLTNHGYPLTLPQHGGTLGSATMYIGLGICMAYRMGLHKLQLPSDVMLADLVSAARLAFQDPIEKTFPTALKRKLIGRFAEEFFRDESCEVHCGVPVGLVELLSASSYNLPPLPKQPRGRSSKRVLEGAMS